MRGIIAPPHINDRAVEGYEELRWLKPPDADRMYVNWQPTVCGQDFPWRVRLVAEGRDVRAHGRTPGQAMKKALDRWDVGSNHVSWDDYVQPSDHVVDTP